MRPELRASGEHPESPDHLDIVIPIEGGDWKLAATQVEQAMNEVATKNGLVKDAETESPEGILFHYAHGNLVTQVIHLRAGVAATAETQGATSVTGEAKLAVILDDLGQDRGVAEEIFALRYPITLSVLPEQPHSKEIAEEAHRRSYQVMLHLPMESVKNERAEARELHAGMSGQQVNALLAEFLDEVPDVAGVNNHQGSQSTADVALMQALMRALRERNLFYVDSRTTAATVAYDSARKTGVRTAFRNTPFLDDTEDISAVRRQLETALRNAREHGEAVAIGHPHSATLRALQEILPKAKGLGVRLVFASELVH